VIASPQVINWDSEAIGYGLLSDWPQLMGPVPNVYGFKIIERNIFYGDVTVGVISRHIACPLQDIPQRGHVRHDFLLSKLLN